MKNEYSKPEMEVIVFKEMDVITTSGDDRPTDLPDDEW